jgi:hypothetical protein
VELTVNVLVILNDLGVIPIGSASTIAAAITVVGLWTRSMREEYHSVISMLATLFDTEWRLAGASLKPSSVEVGN